MKDHNTFSGLFAGKNILVVEDQYFLADDTRGRLQALGARIVGPTARIDRALELIDGNRVDAAILDINIDGDAVFPVAEELEARRVPFIFAMSDDPAVIPDSFNGFILRDSPAELEKIARALFGPTHADN